MLREVVHTALMPVDTRGLNRREVNTLQVMMVRVWSTM